jgi:hypothetical protein
VRAGRPYHQGPHLRPRVELTGSELTVSDTLFRHPPVAPLDWTHEVPRAVWYGPRPHCDDVLSHPAVSPTCTTCSNSPHM